MSPSLCSSMTGVCTRFAQNMGEFSMQRAGYCQMDPPIRLCARSYWNCRGTPVPQRMPSYALIMSATGAPAATARKRLVWVDRKSVGEGKGVDLGGGPIIKKKE